MSVRSELSIVSTASHNVCVCERGLAFLHMRDGMCFLLHLWMCTPHATSNVYRLARKGVVEYACIVWFDSEFLALCRI